MTNSYSSILSYQGDELENYLNDLCLYDIFQELFSVYDDKNTLKCVIKYIVWAYSVESDKIHIGVDWLKNKEQIFEAANVQPNRQLYNDLVLLESEAVRSVINKWLDYQQSDAYRSLSYLKDLRVEMQLASVSQIKKATEEIDYKAKYDCAVYAIELKNKIKDLESELIQNNVILKEAVKEVRTAAKRKETMGVENFSR